MDRMDTEKLDLEIERELELERMEIRQRMVNCETMNWLK